MWGDLIPVGAVRWLDAGRYSFLLTALLSTENGPIVPANYASDYIFVILLDGVRRALVTGSAQRLLKHLRHGRREKRIETALARAMEMGKMAGKDYGG